MTFDPYTFDPVPARGKLERVTSEPFACEAKLDGVRQVLTSWDGEITLTGRRDSVKTGLKLNKIDWVPDLRDAVRTTCIRTHEPFNQVVLDGELYMHRGTSNTVVSVFGSLQPEAVRKQINEPLRFRAFDILFIDGEDIRNWPYSQRRKALEALLQAAQNPYIELVPVFAECHSESQAPQMVDDAYRNAIQNGFEGLVVKTLSGMYDKNAWAKVKPTNTYDYVFCGIDESTSTTYAGWGAAAIRLGLYVNGVAVEVTRCSGMTEYWRAEFFAHWQKYVGMTVEVIAQQQFPTGALRHPRFSKLRPDVNATDQTIEKYNLHRDEIVTL